MMDLFSGGFSGSSASSAQGRSGDVHGGGVQLDAAFMRDSNVSMVLLLVGGLALGIGVAVYLRRR